MTEQNNKLSYTQLKETCPKAVEAYTAWTKEKLAAFQKFAMAQIDVKENVKIPEVTDEHAVKASEAMLSSYFRTLYDFFDSQGVYVETSMSGEKDWRAAINGDVMFGNMESRIEAEIVGFKQAFATLEGIL